MELSEQIANTNSEVASSGLFNGWRTRISGHVGPDIERAAVACYLLLRLLHAVAILVFIPRALQLVTNDGVWLLATIATLCCAVLIGWKLWQAARVVAAWGLVDLVTTLIAFPIVASVVPTSLQATGWAMWVTPWAVATATIVGLWAPTLLRALFLSVLIAITYLATARIWSGADLWGLLGSAVWYPGFALFARLLFSYVRGLAREAMKARAEAVAAVAELELERYRLLVHDASGILRLLAEPELPDEVKRAVSMQAIAESIRIRSYLQPQQQIPQQTVDGTLGAVIVNATLGFSDLPIDLLIDLGSQAPIDTNQAHAVEKALVTVFHNVRLHSKATSVVVHADYLDQRWEVSVQDNGIGFDRTSQPWGFGLKHQVHDLLKKHGLEVVIKSSPGLGTNVLIAGPSR